MSGHLRKFQGNHGNIRELIHYNSYDISEEVKKATFKIESAI